MAIERDGDGPPMRRKEKPQDGDAAGAGEADLRAAPFTDQVFDDDYYGRRPAGGGGRSFGLIAGVLFGVAIAAAGGWYAFQNRAELMGGGSAEPVVVKADPAPYKVKPANPGGLQVADQDKMIYDRVAKPDEPRRVENLLPPPEKPKAPPITKPAMETAPAVEKPVESASAPESASKRPLETSNAVPKAAETASKPAPVVAESAPKPAAPVAEKASEPAVDPLVAAVAAAAPGRVSATAQANPPTTATVSAPPPPAEKQVASLPTGAGVQVQLAAARSDEAAQAEWIRLSNRYKDLLGGLSPNVLRVDLGEKGVFFRLRAGPVADQASAQQLCETLSAQNVACLVVKP